MAKEKAADFRYNSGPARISWNAVGERLRQQEMFEIVKFLCPSSAAKAGQYAKQLQKVKGELQKLAELSDGATKLSLGKCVKKAEQETAKLLGAKYATFLTNATAGFEIANRFAGLGPGDEIIIPAITFIATMLYPLSIGAKVVLADVDPRTINLDPKDVERKITKRTKAIMPVHIGGYPVEMTGIMKLARKHDITVIEDAAHAFGGEYKGKMLGTIGHFGAFSFHEVKNITALGEGGVLVTNTAYGKQFDMARFAGLNIAKQIPNWLYDVDALKGKAGYFATGNYSSTEVQALCLLQQLKRLGKIISKRRKAAEYLSKRFEKVDGIVPQLLDSNKVKATYHLYLLQIDPEKAGGDIQVLKKKLGKQGVTQIPHFAPLYKFSIMDQLGYDTKKIQASCPVAEDVFNHRFTHLPLYNLSREQLKYMADAVIESIKEMKKGR